MGVPKAEINLYNVHDYWEVNTKYTYMAILSLIKTSLHSGFSIIRTAVCQYNLNTAQISELVGISEQAINLTVLHNRRHDRQKSATMGE